MGMVLGLGILWIYTGILYRKYAGANLKQNLSVTMALHRVDMATILFFLGILLSVGALQCSGILSKMSMWLDNIVGSQGIIISIIGIVSAVIDNVPLVAAAQGMYSYPMDSFFWEFLAYAVGTGGSILIIGSAAGVTAMSLEKINFIWYLKKVSGWALLGYLTGIGVYLLEVVLLGEAIM
jgi:Na+/H+ antiporter NhaD/arsenite permease-like protein